MKFKTIQNEKEMGKISLTADITAFIFKKTPSDKILEILRLFQSSGENKISYTSYQQQPVQKCNFLKYMPFPTDIKHMRYIKINITKGISNLYKENHTAIKRK